MQSAPLFVFACITPRAEYFQMARAAILDIIEQTRAEAGCEQFVLHCDEAETQLFLYEQWRSEDDLQQHYAQDYTKKVFAAYEQWLAKPVAVQKMRPCELPSK